MITFYILKLEHCMSGKKILFILRRRIDYNSQKHGSSNSLSTGLYNSATYMHEMLLNAGIDSKICVVEDNNKIDKEVSEYKPTHVIIEALWVVPSKFSVLCKLHPKVKWIIRLHSEIPFLGNEGIAFDWIGDYITFKNVIIAPNAKRALKDIRSFVKTKTDWTDSYIEKKVILLPNSYPTVSKRKTYSANDEYIDVGCFGAVRPMKNHVIQALAAIEFAESIGKKLRFHINSGRVEQRGESVINNLIGIFAHVYDSGHRLINHDWLPREKFIELCSTIDIGMQVSFSETFNIVAADMLSQGVPIVVSEEIPWSNPIFEASPTDRTEMVRKLKLTNKFNWINVYTNQKLLNIYTNKTRNIWLKHFK